MPDVKLTGRAPNDRGTKWERIVATGMLPWFPGAERRGKRGKTGPGDLDGVGDRIIECTTQPMSELAKKLNQAEADAIRAGYREYWVVKRAAGYPAGRAYVITRAEVLWPLLARLDRLDQWEAEQAATREAL